MRGGGVRGGTSCPRHLVPRRCWPAAQGSGEDPDYLTRQLITYLGNKRNLLGPIGQAVEEVKRRLGKPRLRVFDAFNGSGVVARFFKAHASLVVSNDIEDYAAAIGRCYLRNRSTVDWAGLRAAVDELNRRVLAEPLPAGFIERLYAPRDDADIRPGERVFYARENARRLDNYRRLIELMPADWHHLLLGPLLSEASIHANTADVFKGFYKDRQTRVGQFGGSGRDALPRILAPIRLEVPVLSRFECDWQVLQQNANQTARQLCGLDLAYLDPPYNQHPYGSNYFMLNLLVRYRQPRRISRVLGIPADWRRSGYNLRRRSRALLADLLEAIDASFLLVSYNNEGFIGPTEMAAMLGRLGSLQAIQTRYNAFRGSRSFRNRSLHVVEQLFLVQRR